MRRLIVHPAAAAEFEEAVIYHETQIAGLGSELRAEVEKAFDRLSASPHLCPPHRRTGYRKCFVARFRYTIFFLELPEALWVAAVTHGSREPGYWSSTTPENPADR